MTRFYHEIDSSCDGRTTLPTMRSAFRSALPIALILASACGDTGDGDREAPMAVIEVAAKSIVGDVYLDASQSKSPGGSIETYTFEVAEAFRKEGALHLHSLGAVRQAVGDEGNHCARKGHGSQ